MIDGQHVPPIRVNVLERAQLLLRVAQVADLGQIVHVLEWIDAERFAVPAADDPAGFLRSISTSERNQLFQLLP